MFYDVRVICQNEGKSIVTIRKVFPKKRKRNKIAGLERNYVATKKRYVVTNVLRMYIPHKGRITILFPNKEVVTKKLRIGDKLEITPKKIIHYF